MRRPPRWRDRTLIVPLVLLLAVVIIWLLWPHGRALASILYVVAMLSNLGRTIFRQVREPIDDRPPGPWPDETGIVRWRRQRREKAAARSSGKPVS
jgi:hypothetical protein